MSKIYLAGLLKDTFANGPGVRWAFFAQGCKHECKGCFNQHTWDFKNGHEFETDDLAKQVIDETYLSGVTFTGGDPFEQDEAFYHLAKKLNNNLNIWCYTGYTFEQLLKKSKKQPFTLKLLKNIDVLVDGKFDGNLADEKLKFKGSSNQRIIDVKNSLKSNKIIHFNVE